MLRSTSDLALAGYVHMQGLRVVKGERLNGGRFRFAFEDPGDDWEELKQGFANSESLRFDSSVRALKKMCHG